MKFEFQTSDETPVGVELKLVLRIDAESDFKILLGTISENFPKFGDKDVVCSIKFTVSTEKRIECTGIGVFSDRAKYHIAFKVFFYLFQKININ